MEATLRGEIKLLKFPAKEGPLLRGPPTLAVSVFGEVGEVGEVGDELSSDVSFISLTVFRIFLYSSTKVSLPELGSIILPSLDILIWNSYIH